MHVLTVILARAGSKGLPNKCLRTLSGRAVIEYTFDHALQSKRTDAVVFSTDCPEAAALGQRRGIEWVQRPADLAHDAATVDAAVRQTVLAYESQRGVGVDLVVILYGNIPVRRPGVIDEAIRHLIETEADSVRTVAPVGKHHPDWMFRLDRDRMGQYRPNSHYRRQDLEPLYVLNGAVTVVTRRALFAALDHPDDHQAFLGTDRRAIVVAPHQTVDIDEPIDLFVAEAILASTAPSPPVPAM
jgi:N-acylneuraminate cytidylyltransferase